MQLSKNFSLSELTHTNYNIPNEPTGVQIARLTDLCTHCLQPIREFYGKAIKITSGFRSQGVNKAAKGSATSSHCYGYAADTKPQDGNMVAYQKAILAWANKPDSQYDQIILEMTDSKGLSRWIHIGVRRGRDNAQRRQILYTTDGKSYLPVTKGSKFYLA